ncbi:imm11 family protein [Paenibacillus qinlingensis]|uniref:Immunity MXAN-0049 protein domain-containing protein n=1 Tax=Paenibacillus qinlingensis TaxID=1837343 RepID=A0ABU1P1Z6_9BACL|nr:DUF1629 domain-containing protein [Paenibacillus qinlingensis]MDR6553765.1 hypothetical protein [Paenibacillus qinlingensis]
MKIWKWNYKESTLTRSNHLEFSNLFLDGFIGEKMSDNWPTIYMEDINKKGRLYDCTGLTPGKPILNEKAVNNLAYFLDGKAEELPLKHAREPYYVINVINVVNCLDYEKSDLVIHDKYKVVKDIKRYVFKEDMVQGQAIFKIPEFKGSYIFVTDEFRNSVLESGLTGFEFHEVWNSENSEPEVISLEQYLITAGIDRAEYSFKDVFELLEKGKAFGNGKFKLQNNENQRMLIGEVTTDGGYRWIEPIYYPSSFLDMKWYLVEKSHL